MTTASTADNDRDRQGRQGREGREQAPVAVTTDASDAITVAQAPTDETAAASFDPIPSPPADLAVYWDEIDEELAVLPAAP